MSKKGKGAVRRLRECRHAEYVLERATTDAPESVRDRTLLELVHATDIKLAPLCRLRMADVDFAAQTITAWNKGRTESLTVHVPGRALTWLDEYVHMARPHLAGGKVTALVFIRARGRRVKRRWARRRIDRYVG
jgi:site-specific recombinase XerD